MKHAWTGGQYSLWRALLGGALALHFGRRLWILCTLSHASTLTIAYPASRTSWHTRDSKSAPEAPRQRSSEDGK